MAAEVIVVGCCGPSALSHGIYEVSLGYVRQVEVSLGYVRCSKGVYTERGSLRLAEKGITAKLVHIPYNI